MKLIGIFLCVVIFVSRYFIVQGTQEIIFERIDILYVNHTLGDVNCTVKRINRTNYALTGYASIYEDGLAEATDIIIQAYTLRNNEFRVAPLFIKRKVCDFLKSEYIYLKHSVMNTEGHVPDKCPVEKGSYYLKNYILDSSQLPQLPVMKAAMLYVNFTLHKQLGASFKIYVRFNQDAKNN